MDAKLYAGLVEKIQKWSDENCEEDWWPEIVIGNDTVEMMAKSAACVFDACVESQRFGKEEGLFED
jgi:hypothetical protein